MSIDRRHFLAGAAGVAGAVGLTGCGVGHRADRNALGDLGQKPEPGAREVRLAHPYEPAHPVQQKGVTALQQSLRGSGLSVISYPSGQLGSEAQTLEQVASGALDIAIAGPAFLGVWHAPMAVLDAAYLLKSIDSFVKTVNGPVMKREYDTLYNLRGVKVLSGWYYGTRHTTANKAVRRPQDAVGLKIRTPDAPIYLENLKVMGGVATPMALSEVYLALQQGVIDAQENPVPTIKSQKFFEVQRFLSLTGHIVQGVFWITGRTFYEGLSDSERDRLHKAMDAGAQATRQAIETDEKQTLAQWKKARTIQVVEDVDLEIYRKRARQMIPKAVSWGDLYEQLQEQ